MVDQLVVIGSITLLVMLTPGPDMALVLRNTVVGGRRAGLATSAGILAGNLVHITYCVLGLGALIARSIVAFAVLKYASAAYLIYLGVMTYRSGESELDTSPVDGERRTYFGQGLLNNLLNPKAALFYLGVFAVVLTPGTSRMAALMLVSTAPLIGGAFWLVFVYSLDSTLVRRYIHGWQRAISRTCGAALVILGLRVALTSR